jgi:hypothetical protein
MLISIISLGGVVVLISCIRLVVLLEFQEKNADFTFVLGKLIIISSIELEVAIMAANAPSLKILWSKWFGRQTFNGTLKEYDISPSNASSRSRGTRRKSAYSGEPSYLVNCSNYVPMSPTPRKETPDRGLKNDSEEQLWKHDSGIIVTSSVGVETHIVAPLSPPPAAKPYVNQFDAV